MDNINVMTEPMNKAPVNINAGPEAVNISRPGEQQAGLQNAGMEEQLLVNAAAQEAALAPEQKAGQAKKAAKGKKKKKELLSANLKQVLEIQKDQDFAKNLLKDSFKAGNKTYEESGDYAKDAKSVADYEQKVGDVVAKDKMMSYADRITKKNRLMNVRITKLAGDKKFGFFGDDDDMKNIKTSINLL